MFIPQHWQRLCLIHTLGKLTVCSRLAQVSEQSAHGQLSIRENILHLNNKGKKTGNVRNSVARSRNHCCSENATIHFVFFPHYLINYTIFGGEKNIYKLTAASDVWVASKETFWGLGSTRRIFMKFDIWGFFQNLPRKLTFYLNRTRIKGTLHEDQYTFLIISR